MNVIELYQHIRPKIIIPSLGVNFEPSTEFYNNLSDGDQLGLQRAINTLCEHMGMKPPQGSYEWSIKFTPEVAGSYHILENEIRVPVVMAGNSHALGQILAHELAHHYALNNRIHLPDRNENERLTDVISILLGFGKLVLSGKNTIDDVYTIHSLGYIDSREICMIYERYLLDNEIKDGYANLTQNGNELQQQFLEWKNQNC